MSYATPQEFIEIFGFDEALQLTTLDNPSATAVDNAVLQTALDDASDEIDGYLQARYSLPITPQPKVLRRLSADIARYRLDRYMAREDARQRYEDALDFLKSVSRGLIQLGLNQSGEPTPSLGSPQTIQGDRTFSRETLRDY